MSDARFGDTNFDDVYRRALHSPERAEALLGLEFMRQLRQEMDAKGLSTAEISSLIGIREPHLLALVEGRARLTFKTMIRIAMAAGLRLTLTLTPDDRQKDQDAH